MENKNDLAIFITSFDGYSDLWNPFFEIFNYYWGDCKYNMYLSSNYKNYSYRNLKVLSIGQEISWKDRMLKSLEKINEEYVLIFLEDYFLGNVVKNKDIEEIMDFIKKNNVLMYRIAHYPKPKKNKGIVGNAIPIFKDQRYGVNFQCAIWNKKHLYKIIESLENSSCWDFEYYFLKIASKSTHELYKYYFVDKRNLFNIKNGVLKGKWIPSTVKYYRKKGVDFKLSQREFLSKAEVLKMKTYGIGRKVVPKEANYIFKKILRKIGFKFLSDI